MTLKKKKHLKSNPFLFSPMFKHFKKPKEEKKKWSHDQKLVVSATDV